MWNSQKIFQRYKRADNMGILDVFSKFEKYNLLMPQNEK